MGLPLQWTNTLVWTVLSQQSWIQSFLGRDLASIVATWSTSPGPRMSQFPMRQTQTAHVQTPVWKIVDIFTTVHLSTDITIKETRRVAKGWIGRHPKLKTSSKQVHCSPETTCKMVITPVLWVQSQTTPQGQLCQLCEFFWRPCVAC